ncbi:MAG TPA: YraN family protein [Spirochaetota bacterium]|nr:YraN family protein [Spirochaetota bacterium]HPJ39450.1 YraN family protein [Spirochaetota bacterium]HPQ54482.1 YraN family protein [Spirochaetota bacterium]
MSGSGAKKDLGRWGEDRAAVFLAEQGFTIVCRNYRNGRYGEIDIIAEKEGLLVFAEVKTRNCDFYGGSLYSISERKKATIRRCARRFLMENRRYNTTAVTCRFDLLYHEKGEIFWVEDIIR